MSIGGESDKLTTPRSQKLFFFICWITYCSTYLGRLNFSASLAEISMEADFTKSALGMVSSGFFIGYGIFQLIWGFAGDHLDPVRMVFFGIFVSGLVNLLMSVTHHVELMVVLWTINGIVQAAVWSPLLRLTLERLPGDVSMRASVRYATTVPIGTFAAYLLAAVCALCSSWRIDFAITGLLMVSIAVIWHRSMTVLAPPCKLTVPKAQQCTGCVISSKIWLILIPICLATLVNGFIRDSVQTWMPTYLTEQHGLGGFASIALTLVLPLINLSGVYIGTYMNDRFLHNEVRTSAAAFLTASLLLLPMTIGVQLPIWFTLILFGLCAAMMLAVNTMFITLVPVRLQFTGRTSTLSGILNSATYIGSALSGYGVGWLLENMNWSTVFFSWITGLIVASILCIGFVRMWSKAREGKL